MPTSTKWARVCIAGLTLSASVAACDSVLDIQDPKMRPNDAGAAGEPTTGATSSGGTTNGGSASGSPATAHGGTGEGGEGALGGVGAVSGTGGEGGSTGGEGGVANKDCEPNSLQCSGTDNKTPQVCDQTAHWITNTVQAVSACEFDCIDGKCTECKTGDKRCTACKADDTACDSNLPQTCVAGVWTDETTACAQYCDGGSCKTTPSCDLASTDRTTCAGGQSCCKSLLVPGGSFKRDFDGSEDFPDDTFPATVSPFLLDKFEVTIGRFRQFVTAYEQINLQDGAGKSPHIADDLGWDRDFYTLPKDAETLQTELASCTGATWSDTIDTNKDQPLNCVSFNVAYAFCIWDGGRLPTEAEWNFAAAGGSEQRVYPWQAPPSGPSISNDYANYEDANPGPLAVGSTPLGNGRWGQADLGGNLVEWVLDYYGDYPATCDDCLNVTAALYRSLRGGGYSSSEFFLRSASRTAVSPLALRANVGFRCARDPK